MTASDAPELEGKSDNKHPLHDRAHAEHDDDNDNITAQATELLIKTEDDAPQPTDDDAATHTETSLRSNPVPSSKRREGWVSSSLWGYRANADYWARQMRA